MSLLPFNFTDHTELVLKCTLREEAAVLIKTEFEIYIFGLQGRFHLFLVYRRWIYLNYNFNCVEFKAREMKMKSCMCTRLIFDISLLFCIMF